MRRQERYAASGVRCLWLFRQASFPVDERLPAARILGTPEAGLRASLPDIFERERQELPMREFLVAVFSKRLRFGLPLGVEAQFVVRAARLPCWRCCAWTQILKEVEVTAGPHEACFSVPELGKYAGLWGMVRARLPSTFPTGSIHRRFNKTQGREYLSNGCSHCGAQIGEHLEHEALDGLRIICEYSAALDEAWREVIHRTEGGTVGWGVY
jgi:competence protein CoiA